MNTAGPQRLVVHLVTSLDFGGVESHMLTLARHASAQPERLLFCAIGAGGAVAGQLREAGAEVLCLERDTRLPALPAIAALVRLFRRLRPAVVHCHGAEANFCGLPAAWLAGVPVRVGEEIGMPAHGWLARQAFRLAYRFAQRVIGISDAVTGWLVASGEVPAAKACRMYNPVQLPAFGPLMAAGTDSFLIAFVGRLEAVKNPAVLVAVVARLRKMGVPARLWLVGDGSQRALIERLVADAGLADSVQLHGYQPDPAELVRRCHVYVQPSLSEGFGLAFVEAMGCGVPVLVTATGGAAEIVEPGRTGWIVPDAGADGLVEVLFQAWQGGQPELLAMGRRARAAVEQRFRPEAYLRELDLLYQRVRNGRHLLPAPG
jgi:glycosyltransferase involved in cell wall biosynthesis